MEGTQRRGGILSHLFGRISTHGMAKSAAHDSSIVRAGRPALDRVSAASAASTASAFGIASTRASTDAAILDAPLPQQESNDMGYARNLQQCWEIGRVIGSGGNGQVTTVVCKATGEEFAMKSIRKKLPDATELKQEAHMRAIKNEVMAMQRLSGSLSVCKLEAVYEDEACVHLVMERCSTELFHQAESQHYSERTVASYMRAVLRTIAQFHAAGMLHRDIKPSNFMLLDSSPNAPVKAIDFGLAIPFAPEELPLTDLGLEGTPWYMAPEVLKSRVTPASDVWSAGVMAHQLLTGILPFDDRANPMQANISKVWKSIFTDEVDFSRSCWASISPEAKDFVAQLLNRSPSKRPTAAQALQHPWLRGNKKDRAQGRGLGLQVVKRLQRFGVSSHFRRSVLEFIADELLTSGVCGVMGPDAKVCRVTPSESGMRPVIGGMCDPAMSEILESMQLDDHDVVGREDFSAGLARLGYAGLDPREVNRLVEQVDLGGTGAVQRSTLAASQIDWGTLQEDAKDHWLKLARRAFSALDTDGDGVLSADEIVASLAEKLPREEVAAAVAKAMHEAEGSQPAPEGGMDFNSFMRMLHIRSCDDLELYDDRCSLSASSSLESKLNLLLEQSMHGHDAYASSLQPVPEGEAAASAGTEPATRLRSADSSVHGPQASSPVSGAGLRKLSGVSKPAKRQLNLWVEGVSDLPEASASPQQGDASSRAARAALEPPAKPPSSGSELKPRAINLPVEGCTTPGGGVLTEENLAEHTRRTAAESPAAVMPPSPPPPSNLKRRQLNFW